MTSTEKNEKLRKVYDAWKAGFISNDRCSAKTQDIEREYYIAQYGEFDPSSI